jgi:hypothetical protein
VITRAYGQHTWRLRHTTTPICRGREPLALVFSPALRGLAAHYLAGTARSRVDRNVKLITQFGQVGLGQQDFSIERLG